MSLYIIYKRQASGTSSDNEWQQMVQQMTTNNN